MIRRLARWLPCVRWALVAAARAEREEARFQRALRELHARWRQAKAARVVGLVLEPDEGTRQGQQHGRHVAVVLDADRANADRPQK